MLQLSDRPNYITNSNQQHLYTRTWVGIEPTPSRFWCDALPAELPNLLGARWWGVEYTTVSQVLGAHCITPCMLGSSAGRVSHRISEGVGSIPTQVPGFFYLKKSWDLYASVTGLNL